MTLSLSLLIGLLTIPVIVPLLLQHVKNLARWVGSGREKGSPWPMLAVLFTMFWVFALSRVGILEQEVGAESRLNGWAVLLIGLAVGAIAPLGYDGWQRFRPGSGPSSGGGSTT